jgi:malate dehydrogenase (oxaloacetate-decarboxylating)(NADP+)
MSERSAADLLRDVLHNRGTAYSHEQRACLGLEGLLPPAVESLDLQAARALAAVRGKPTAIERYLYMRALQDENETLFFRTLMDNLEELIPVVYTPTVGQACTEWSRNYLRARGLYISFRHRGRIADLLSRSGQRPGVIVVTDGSRILGLGDLGANGMGIPIGKLALYTACAGIAPELCLPVLLDAGTDNKALLADPLYLGERQARLSGEAYDAFVDEFVHAVASALPSAVLQFEDFSNAHAFELLERHRTRLCCFNDDIQGTGAMGLAALYASGRITGRRLTHERILFVGAGEACLGIGAAATAGMVHEGLSPGEAREQCLFLDSRGAVATARSDLSRQKQAFAKRVEPLGDTLAAIEFFRPTVLIGACAQPGAFDRPVIEAMAKINERPVILALSNPTSRSECDANDAYMWSQGRAVFASGSAFAPVALGTRTFASAQANNCYIFPGFGLGLLASGAREATDEMFVAAARALAAEVTRAELDQGRIFPALGRMRAVAVSIATVVAALAHERKLTAKAHRTNLHSEIADFMYEPRYPSSPDLTFARSTP